MTVSQEGALPRNLIPPTGGQTTAEGGFTDGLLPPAHFTDWDTEAQAGGLAGSGLSASPKAADPALEHRP